GVLAKGETVDVPDGPMVSTGFWPNQEAHDATLRPSLSPLTLLPQFTMPETIDQMIVHHPHGLHESVADRAAHECEVSPLQVLAHGVRFRGLGRDFLNRPPGVLLRLAANKSPNVLVKRSNVVLHGQERLRILDRSLYLQPVADDPGVRQQGLALL